MHGWSRSRSQTRRLSRSRRDIPRLACLLAECRKFSAASRSAGDRIPTRNALEYADYAGEYLALSRTCLSCLTACAGFCCCCCCCCCYSSSCCCWITCWHGLRLTRRSLCPPRTAGGQLAVSRCRGHLAALGCQSPHNIASLIANQNSQRPPRVSPRCPLGPPEPLVLWCSTTGHIDFSAGNLTRRIWGAAAPGTLQAPDDTHARAEPVLGTHPALPAFTSACPAPLSRGGGPLPP